MKWRLPRIWILVAVLAVAVAVAFPPAGGQGGTATPVRNNPTARESLSPQTAPQQHASQPGRIELERLNQQKNKTASNKGVSNAFNPTSWYVAPPTPPPPPPPPPPVPTAPPLPFTYMGRYEDPPKLFVMLSNGGKLYTVSAGDNIDGTYRVDRITRGAVELTYLPLNISQSISTTGAAENAQNRASADQHNGRP